MASSRFVRWYELASPPYFYRWSGRFLFPLGCVVAVLFCIALPWALLWAPPDAVQGNSYRIIFVHVPLSFLALGNYLLATVSALIFLVWRTRLSVCTMYAAIQVGAVLCFLVLLSGSIWAKPTWGDWWVWDARLSSMLLLFFIHLAVLALRESYGAGMSATRACAVLILIGSVDLVVVHKSVDWWYSLHQPASISLVRPPTIDISMWRPLLLMMGGFCCYYFWVLLMWVRYEILAQARATRWVRSLSDF